MNPQNLVNPDDNLDINLTIMRPPIIHIMLAGSTAAPPVGSTVPSTSTSTGSSGQTAFDSNYFYVCIATNSWKRTGLSAW